MGPRPPSGTLTFLFTDIEGSTTWWELDPDGMRVALARHDEILRSAIESAGGYLFTTAGDSFAAAFSSPVVAVDAALAAQRALDAEAWPASIELRVRMGLHTGTAIERDDDYFGPTLNRAARVMALGGGGDVIVSNATAALVRDIARYGVELVDLGEHRLRGLQGGERLFGVVDPVRPVFYDRLSGSSPMSGNLPCFADTFIGRSAELTGLAQAVGPGRLVTLVGPGGVGKTRLAIEAGWEAAEGFTDGVWLFEVASVSDAGAVADAAVAALELRPLPGSDPLDAVVAGLRGRRMLIVVDNCEHVVGAASALCRRILERCPTIGLLATSRAPLRIAGEHVWTLAPLDAGIDAVELFCDRAAAADSRFELGDGRAAVEALCQRLDGIPLAIELAAARVRAMTPADLLVRLDDRFRLLRSGPTADNDRHGTLEATVEWSYQLLRPLEQRVFERFSVFAGAASIGAVASVCCDDTVDEVVVMDAVVELVDQSLVIAELGDVSARYRSLETMRAFARDRLRQRGDLDRFERAHAAHVAAQMGPLTERLRGADELAALRELDQLWPDLRSAVAYAIGEADTDLAVRLVSGLAVEAMYRERIEVSGWADQILDLPGAEVHHLASELLATAAVLDWRCGRAELGYSRAEKAYGICLAEGRPPSVAVNLAVSACGTALGDHDIAPRARADTLARIPAGDLFTRVFLRQLDSMFSSYWGEPRMALKILDEIEPESQRLRNPLLLAQGAWVRMVALLDVEPAAAVDVGNVAVDAAKAIRALWVVDAVTNYLTSALAAAGDLDDALQGVRVVLEHMADGGGVQSLANTARNGLLIFDRLGLPTEAATVVGWLTAHGSEMPGTAGMRQRATEVIQRVEANLDAKRFAVAASHGQTFNDRDLVDFMLQHLPGA